MTKLVAWNGSHYRTYSDALDSGAVYDVRGIDLDAELAQGGHLSALWDLSDCFGSFCEAMGAPADDMQIGASMESQGFSFFLPLSELLSQHERQIALENERTLARMEANK